MIDWSGARQRLALPRWTRAWLGDSTVLLVAQAATVVATSATAIVIARELPTSDWALFSAFLGIAFGFQVLVDFGLGTWLLRELSQILAPGVTPEADAIAGALLRSAIAFNLAVAVVSVAVAAAVSVAVGVGAAGAAAVAVLIVYGASVSVAGVLEARLRAVRRVRRVLVATVLEKVVLVALVLAVAGTDAATVLILAMSYVAAGLARVAVDAASVRGWRGPRPDVRRIVAVARSSVPFALSVTALNVVPRFDTAIVLGLSTTSAAWYALGERVLGPAVIIAVVASATLYPFIAGRESGASWRLVAAMGALGAAVALVGIVTAPVVVPAVFGSRYEPAVGVVQVMLLSLPLSYACNVLLAYLYTAKRERQVVMWTIAMSLAGTAAIVGGQVLGGATYAAAGSVVRQVLFVVALVVLARPPAQAEPHLPRELPQS